MKKLLFLFAFIPALLIGQTTSNFDLSKWHDSNTVLDKADENFNILFNTPVVGVFFSDSAVTVDLTEDLWSYASNATNTLWSGIAHNLSVTTASGDSITIVAPGDYIANITLSFSAAANDTIEMAIFKNNAATVQRVSVEAVGTEILSFTLPAMLFDLVADDNLSIRIRNIAGDQDVKLIHGTAYMFMLKPD